MAIRWCKGEHAQPENTTAFYLFSVFSYCLLYYSETQGKKKPECVKLTTKALSEYLKKSIFMQYLLQYLGTLKTDSNFHGDKQYVTFSMLKGSFMLSVSCSPQTTWLQLQADYLSELHRYPYLDSAGQSGGRIEWYRVLIISSRCNLDK